MAVVKSEKPMRLHGLDFARFLAFAGMVFVNFHVVTGLGDGEVWATGFLTLLEGKAAATFVVLAGIGFGLGARRDKTFNFEVTILKRAAFLLVIGLLNSLVFSADILHYYAVYFVFGLLIVRRSSLMVTLVAVNLPFVFLLLLGVINYEAGWNWQTFEYLDFWTLEGFTRNLLFNGWHPVVPWLSFLLLGIELSRFDLAEKKTHNYFILAGLGALLIAYMGAYSGTALYPEMAEIFTLSPIPPFPLYMLAGSGAAVLIIGLSLKIFAHGPVKWLTPFTKTGKQALTLYIAHIFVGMGALEAFGLLGGQSAELSIFASSLFIISAVIYAVIWAQFFRAGPIEWLMRRIAG